MTTTMNPYAYNITVREIDFDGDSHFEARVKELPDVREYAASAGEAYELAIDTIETAAAMFADEDRSFPSPAVLQDDFSGRVTLRLSRSLHRALAYRAGDEGVSLNQHLVNVLTYDQGFRTGGRISAHAFVSSALSRRRTLAAISRVPNEDADPWQEVLTPRRLPHMTADLAA
ncbi:MAG: toxin-antitoxin system HicB family antitoxin [Pseudomonadales bacterium]|nr:toxin-antitoxin system HicB family antitoxin [Pseudomonadales bacterium]